MNKKDERNSVKRRSGRYVRGINPSNEFQQREEEQRRFLERAEFIRRAFNKYVTEVPFNIIGEDGDYHIKAFDPFQDKLRIFRLNDELISALEGVILEYMTIDYSLEQLIELDHPASEELVKLRMVVLEDN